MWRLLGFSTRWTCTIAGVSGATAQGMQGNLRPAVDANGDDARPDADRGVPDHVAIPPQPRSHPPRQLRVEGDRDGAGQADLAAMRVTAQYQVEIGVRRLAIDLGRVRQQDRKPVIGELGNG